MGEKKKKDGCDCSAGSAPGLALLGLFFLLRRRR